MKRELKFRVWDGEQMISPDYISRTGSAHWKENSIPTYSSNVMQFVNLKDRNGKEIFEGDIVRWGTGGDSDYDQESWHRYAVVEINPDIQFRIIYYIEAKTGDKKPTDNYAFKYGNFAYKDTNKYLEVIGNIHENSDIIR